MFKRLKTNFFWYFCIENCDEVSKSLLFILNDYLLTDGSQFNDITCSSEKLGRTFFMTSTDINVTYQNQTLSFLN